MAITNIHPHVGVQVNANKRKAVVAEEPKVPVMFAPFVSNKGPVGISYKTNGGVLKCYSNSEFISVYGDLELKEQGQQVLNIGNWLENGGAVLPMRMWEAPSATSGYRLATLDSTAVKYDENDTAILFAVNGNISTTSHSPANAVDPTNPDFYCAYYQGNLIPASIKKCASNETYASTKTYYTEVTAEQHTSTDKVVDGKYYRAATLSSAPSSWDDYYVDYADAHGIAVVRAKYPGSYYYGLKVSIEKTGNGVFNVIVKNENNKEIERFTRKTIDTYKTITSASDYVGVLYFDEDVLEELSVYDRTLGSDKNTFNMTMKFAALSTNDTYENFKNRYDNVFVDRMVVTALSALEDRLQIKCDYILDAGYSNDTKKGIIDTLYDTTQKGKGLFRDDIIFLADSYVLDYKNNLIPSVATPLTSITFSTSIDKSRVVYFDQYLTTEDVFSKTGNVEAYVTPTYFLAGIVPANEIKYGPFFPNAGKNRAVISGAKSLSHNPLPSEKDDNTAAHVNYIEKDSKTMQFMQQYTLETENTALQWWNNVRCVNKMSNDIEEIGRMYLFEDTTDSTLRNLQNAIEKYMTNWVLGKALKKCIVDVYADDNDDTLVHVALQIQFNGTIEIISVEINLD